VGRAAELQLLKAAFEEAANGQGALIMLVGEPGIGKTALCEQLGRFASASGGRPLFGHCYEEGSFRPPYQAFVEAFTAYLRDCDANTLTADLDWGVADLARIVPILRERLHVSPSPPGDPEEDRWRLLRAATDLLRSAATKQPVLLVLEDLHDADRGTLDLLLYMARNLQGARLLVVGTYRDVDVDRTHPLSAALSELHRASHVLRLHLRGLSTDEVLHLLAETSQQRVPPPFAELVHHQTDGNPLFVHQVLRFVIEEGFVERRDGALQRVGAESFSGRIPEGLLPEGLRDAVGKRLSRLDDSTNRVLSAASVIGREFQLDVLRQVVSCPEEELEGALEEASTAGIVEAQSVIGATIIYRFSHAFFRRTLYDEIMVPRRIRLHQHIARVLEEVHGRRLEEHAAELAEHYAFSSDTSDLIKAVRYCELAARRATEVFAHGEAARQLDRALVLQDLVDPDDAAKRCDQLLALGEALFPAGQNERVITHVAPDALELADALADRSRAFRACRLALDCLYARGPRTGADQSEYVSWAEKAARYAAPDSIERIHADLALAMTWNLQGRPEETRKLRLEALALARQCGDPETLFRSGFYLLTTGAPQHWDERVRLAVEAAGWPRRGVSDQTLGWLLWSCGCVQLALGNRTQAEDLWRQMEQLARRTHVTSTSVLVPRRDAVLAIIDGHLQDALVLITRFIERADESGAASRGRQWGLQMLLAPALYLGCADAWLTAFSEYSGEASPGMSAAPAMCLAQLGRIEEARSLVEPLLDQVEAQGVESETSISILAVLLEAAVVLDHRRAARALTDRLACLAHLAVGDFFYTVLGRHLGEAAALLSDHTAARAYYAQALEAAGKIRFRPEIALIHLRLAELTLEEGEDSEAVEHLDVAIPELRDMSMQPALERGLSLLKQIENRVPAPASAAVVSPVLTGREQEVARLLAGGRSNREIADTLVITEGTVEVHVKHILSKLGLRSRSQVAAWAAEERI
jgi:DNA-binding CsgD family transcriptional regulator